MDPLIYVAIALVVFCVILLTGMILKSRYDKRKGLYSPATCSVCGQPTGFQGNRCFKLIGGHICETCANKLVPNLQTQGLSFDWFLKNSVYNTVDDASAFIKAKEELEAK